MIGFVLGTSEGKEILSLMNEFTEEIVVSTATKYGGDLLKNYNTKFINNEPLDRDGFKGLIDKYKLKVIVDASHPYAKEVSKNVINVCKELNIDYLRYERKSFIDQMKIEDKIIRITDYVELKDILKEINGNILNATGSNNIEKIISLNLKNRVIHRILPSVKVLKKLIDLEVSIDDIVAIKGPFSYELNEGLFKQYNIRALITKDSGLEGGTKEKVEAALNNEVQVIVLARPKMYCELTFNEVHELVDYIKKKYF